MPANCDRALRKPARFFGRCTRASKAPENPCFAAGFLGWDRYIRTQEGYITPWDGMHKTNQGDGPLKPMPGVAKDCIVGTQSDDN